LKGGTVRRAEAQGRNRPDERQGETRMYRSTKRSWWAMTRGKKHRSTKELAKKCKGGFRGKESGEVQGGNFTKKPTAMSTQIMEGGGNRNFTQPSLRVRRKIVEVVGVDGLGRNPQGSLLEINLPFRAETSAQGEGIDVSNREEVGLTRGGRKSK